MRRQVYVLVYKFAADDSVWTIFGEDRIGVKQFSARGCTCDGAIDVIDFAIGAKAKRIEFTGTKKVFPRRIVISESLQGTGDPKLEFRVFTINAGCGEI